MSNKQQAIVVDLDGTLCNISHRLHLLDMEPGREDKPVKDWESFFEEMHKDELQPWCAEIIRRFADDYAIIFCTGRSDPYRKKTEDWLKTHLPDVEGWILIMR